MLVPQLLEHCLSITFAQTLPLQELVIVDNDPSVPSRSVINEFITRGHAITIISSDRNLGPAGGLATGLRVVLSKASPDDLVALFDDNDPIPALDTLESLVAFFTERRNHDARTAGVGLRGATFCWRSARSRLVGAGGLGGPASVNHLYGGYVPIYCLGSVT